MTDINTNYKSLLEDTALDQYFAPGCSYTEMRVKISDDVNLYCIKIMPPAATDNPVVMFIPGWISRITSWQHALRELTRDHAVIYVETRDKTSSQLAKSTSLSVKSIASDIMYLIKYFELESGKYLLFGSSLGATAILESYVQLITRPRAFILVGPNAEFKIPWWGSILIFLFPPPLYLVMRPFLKWYLKTFRLDIDADQDQYNKYCENLDDTDPYKLKKAASSLQHYRVWELLPDINLPVLIFGSDVDHLHDPGNISQMLPLLPDATLINMTNNTHTHSSDMVIKLREYIRNLDN